MSLLSIKTFIIISTCSPVSTSSYTSSSLKLKSLKISSNKTVRISQYSFSFINISSIIGGMQGYVKQNICSFINTLKLFSFSSIEYIFPSLL